MAPPAAPGGGPDASERRAQLDLGLATVGVEHVLQVGLLDAFRRALDEPVARQAGAAALDQLREYTQVHFLSEQLLMRLHGYPGYEAHVREHERLLHELHALERRFRAGELPASLATAELLRDWLEQHMREMDRALTDYLRALGRAEA